MATGITTRISSLDSGYTSGMLSLFPETYDDRSQLYWATNNASTTLRVGLTYSSNQIILSEAGKFPESGIVALSSTSGAAAVELVYYSSRTDTVLSGLIRGFCGTRQNVWPSGTVCRASVMAEHHNAVKDAILNIQQTLGLSVSPDDASLNGILTAAENRFLSPRAFFRGYPLQGPPGQVISFQNFSEGDAVRFLWDFGDGTKSIERNPTHQYTQDGTYTVTLNVITRTGAQGITTKTDYVTISTEDRVPFFYAVPTILELPNYCSQTASALGLSYSQTFQFVDQTDGDIVQRYWVYDDGESDSVSDTNIHTSTHAYAAPGTYTPSLLVVFGDQNLKRVFLSNSITVI